MTEPQPPSDTHHPNGTTTTTATTLTTVPPPQTTTPSDPPPPTKRQRRPSVRLGEIGDQIFENPNTNTNTNTNKRSINNQKYKHPLSKDSKPTSKSIKSLNLGGPHNNNFSDGGWKVKSKNSKRVRSNWGAINDDVVDMDDYDDVDRYSDQSLNVSREGGEFRVSSGPSDNAGEMERNGVRVWLNQIGLGRYYSVFEVHEVDDEVLPLLTLEDLKDMGINAVGSRRKMFCSIQKLGKGFS